MCPNIGYAFTKKRRIKEYDESYRRERRRKKGEQVKQNKPRKIERRRNLFFERLQVLKTYKLMKQASKNRVKVTDSCKTDVMLKDFVNIKHKRRETIFAQTKLAKEYFIHNSTPTSDERSVSRKTNLQRRDLRKCGRELYRELTKFIQVFQ